MTTPEENKPATNVPAVVNPTNNAVGSVKNYEPENDFEGMEASDRKTPRIRIMQALSPDVVAERFRPGQIVIPGQEVVIERGKMEMCVPLTFYKTWTKFNPNQNCDKKEIVLDRSMDPTSALAAEAKRFIKIKNSKGNDMFTVTEAYNFVLLIPNVGGWGGTYMLQLHKGAFNAGKDWINRMERMRDPETQRVQNMWKYSYEFGTKLEERNGNKFYVPVFGIQAPVAKERHMGLFDMAAILREQKIQLFERAAQQDAEEAAAEQAVQSPNAEM